MNDGGLVLGENAPKSKCGQAMNQKERQCRAINKKPHSLECGYVPEK